MRGNNSKRSRGSYAREFAAVCAVLAMALALSARPAAAAPFVYVGNFVDNTISVIDTATNMVVATLPSGAVGGIAITPDGTHAYVTNPNASAVSVIDTSTNAVVATVGVGSFPGGVAVTPDGAHAYVTNTAFNTVSVIATATNTVVATVTVGSAPGGVAVTPDGQHAYVANAGDNTVSVIATATNTVVGTPIHVEENPFAVAITPDGTHAYVTNNLSGSVSVIDTASNTVMTTVTGAVLPEGLAITPDGTHVYVANCACFSFGGGVVSVIATASNTVVATIPALNNPYGIAITPDGTRAYVTNEGRGSGTTVSVIATASNTVMDTVNVGTGPGVIAIIPDIPFAAFSPTVMINFGNTPNTDAFILKSSFTLGSTSKGINPPAQPVTLQIGTFGVTIPPGSFTGTVTSSAFGPFFFNGVINGVSLHAAIAPTGAKRFSFQAAAQDASLTGTVNPVPVTLTIGNNSSTASVTATIHGGSASKVH
jgi:YVTN family beta-propeller protein